MKKSMSEKILENLTNRIGHVPTSEEIRQWLNGMGWVMLTEELNDHIEAEVVE